MNNSRQTDRQTSIEAGSMNASEANYCTYILTDPYANCVFYVGMSNDPIERYIAHIKGLDGTNPAKNARIQDIMSKGSIPGMYVTHHSLTKEQALIKEAYGIEHYRMMGHPLTNQSLRLGYQYSEKDQIEHEKMKAFLEKSKRGWFSKLFGLGNSYIYWLPPKPHVKPVRRSKRRG